MLNLFTTASEAPFLKASETKSFPFNFFPLIAKNTSFFFNVLVSIDIFLIDKFFRELLLDCSLIILNFKFFDKDLFFNLIESKIIFLSEK